MLVIVESGLHVVDLVGDVFVLVDERTELLDLLGDSLADMSFLSHLRNLESGRHALEIDQLLVSLLDLTLNLVKSLAELALGVGVLVDLLVDRVELGLVSNSAELTVKIVEEIVLHVDFLNGALDVSEVLNHLAHSLGVSLSVCRRVGTRQVWPG